MFRDGVYNLGRALVFVEFTKQVCRAHPTIAADVLSVYIQYVHVILSRLYDVYVRPY